jgi:hypothetical protein
MTVLYESIEDLFVTTLADSAAHVFEFGLFLRQGWKDQTD